MTFWFPSSRAFHAQAGTEVHCRTHPLSRISFRSSSETSTRRRSFRTAGENVSDRGWPGSKPRDAIAEYIQLLNIDYSSARPPRIAC